MYAYVSNSPTNFVDSWGLCGGPSVPAPKPPKPPTYKICTGFAHVLAGNNWLIGQNGGLSRPVPPNSSAVFVGQFGGSTPGVRNNANSISGSVQLPNGYFTFGSIGDTIGNLDPGAQSNLNAWQKAGLVLELQSLPPNLAPKGGDLYPVKITVPINFPCPKFTNATDWF